MLRFSVLLVALVPLLAPTALAESPTHGACDASGRLVCAGADVGANVGCTIDASGLASCAWTSGWLLEGSSPLLLPGRESHEVNVTVSVCSSVSGCVSTPFHHAGACGWSGLATCLDDQAGPAGSLAQQLALGECLTVTVDVAASIEASVIDSVATIASARFANHGQGAGAACHVDDGR